MVETDSTEVDITYLKMKEKLISIIIIVTIFQYHLFNSY